MTTWPLCRGEPRRRHGRNGSGARCMRTGCRANSVTGQPLRWSREVHLHGDAIPAFQPLKSPPSRRQAFRQTCGGCAGRVRSSAPRSVPPPQARRASIVVVVQRRRQYQPCAATTGTHRSRYTFIAPRLRPSERRDGDRGLGVIHPASSWNRYSLQRLARRTPALSRTRATAGRGAGAHSLSQTRGGHSPAPHGPLHEDD